MNAPEIRYACVLAWLSMGALVTGSCGAEAGNPGAERGATASLAELGATDPETFFADLEARWLQDPESRIDFRITAEGTFTAALEGELFLGEGNEVALRSEGTFGSDSVSLSLEVAEGQMIGGNNERRFEEPVPAGLREALVIGLTRMGLVHNLARLVSGAPPDQADGTVWAWVQGRAFDWVAQESAGGRRGVSFQVWVEEQAAADAVLWLDAGGWPVAREQTVRFPSGEMRVHEAYEIR